MRPALVLCSAVLALVALPILTLQAQSPSAPRDTVSATDSLSRPAQALAPMVVTATRGPRKVLDVPGAVSVITSADLNRRPTSSVISFLADLPGLDLTGVGPNQGRPVIRGFSGQRVLLLEDGLRVNNTRRQQDFGELPALVDQASLQRVEVVRGPASVLYGSDAIGGVVNMVSADLPSAMGGNALHGNLRFGYTGGAAATAQPSGALAMRQGPVAFRFDADYRKADPYQAPSGTFGDLTLDAPVTVNGSGVADRHFRGHAAVDIAAGQQLFARYTDYRATDAGFGFIDPSLVGQYQPSVNIRYPLQQVRRGTLGYHGERLNLGLADRVDIAIYRSGNSRDLDQDIFVPFGPGTPDGAGVAVVTRNFTDVKTTGARLEAARSLGRNHTITWGAEFSRDRADGSDSSASTVTGFGPPQTEISTTPALPDASFRSLGFFAQDEIRASARLSLIIGGRHQDNRTQSYATAGLDQLPARATDAATVWAVNALYRLTDDVRLIAAASRGFRSPNLVERYYNGVTPEGSGFQSRNLDLRPETSVDLDLGVRVQRRRWSLEAFAFQNRLRDGIRIAATGDTVMGFPEYQNVNVDRLRIRGFEASGTVSPFAGTTLLANYTNLSQTDTDRPLEPVGDGYGSKLVLGARYRIPSGRAWAGVRYRHQGSRPSSAAESSLVGATTPGFDVLDIDLGLLPLQLGSTASVLTATLENATDALYAEAGNAGFFRPAASRRLLLAWRTAF